MSSIDENNISLAAGRLKEERKRLGMSQQSAAETCDVSREMWGKYERGQSVPGGEVLFAFAAAGADVQYILTGVRMGAVTEPQARFALTPRKKKLLDLIEMLDEKGQEEIQEELEKIKRMKELEREVAELKQRAGGGQNKA